MVKKEKQRHKCMCCGYYTLIGTLEDIAWDICPVCFWENDVFKEDEDAYSGANHMTLGEGRDNFQRFGVCDKRSIQHVRKPKQEEFSDNK